jgi:hypothetical protein
LLLAKRLGFLLAIAAPIRRGHAGRLVDQLKSRFGDQVFFDVDSIRPGANFREVIEETFTNCGALIVLIGKRWLERDTGMPRFGDDQDVITQEIRLAIACKLPILPVLVDGASMPGESQLPPSLASLSSLNAIDLRHTSFDRDLRAVDDHLVETLGGAKETMIEKFALKLYGPFLGNSLAKIQGGIVLFSAMGALWALGELAGAAFIPGAVGWKRYSHLQLSMQRPHVSRRSGPQPSERSFSLSSDEDRYAGGATRRSSCGSRWQR